MQEKDARQLLCTFTNSKDFKRTAEDIKNFYEVYCKRIFAFANIKEPDELYLTYNVLNMQKNSPKFPNTILIHRKKQTNTLYSLNALNTLISEENGCLDKSYVLDWKLYENSPVISGNVSVRIIPLKIFTLIEE